MASSAWKRTAARTGKATADMFAQILGIALGAFLGWAAVLTVLLYFLGFPPLYEVLDVLLQTIKLGGWL